MALAIQTALGIAIRELRSEQGLTQEELGRRAGLHRAHIGEIERGETKPTIHSIELIATVLSVKASELVALAEKIQPLRLRS